MFHHYCDPLTSRHSKPFRGYMTLLQNEQSNRNGVVVSSVAPTKTFLCDLNKGLKVSHFALSNLNASGSDLLDVKMSRNSFEVVDNLSLPKSSKSN